MKHFQTTLERAQALIVKGDPDGAIPLLGDALNAEFYDDETLYLLGGCLIEKGANGLAAVVTSAAIDARKAKGKPFPEAMMNLGTAYKREHRNDIAERIWEQASQRLRSGAICNTLEARDGRLAGIAYLQELSFDASDVELLVDGKAP